MPPKTKKPDEKPERNKAKRESDGKPAHGNGNVRLQYKLEFDRLPTRHQYAELKSIIIRLAGTASIFLIVFLIIWRL